MKGKCNWQIAKKTKEEIEMKKELRETKREQRIKEVKYLKDILLRALFLILFAVIFFRSSFANDRILELTGHADKLKQMKSMFALCASSVCFILIIERVDKILALKGKKTIVDRLLNKVIINGLEDETKEEGN